MNLTADRTTRNSVYYAYYAGYDAAYYSVTRSAGYGAYGYNATYVAAYAATRNATHTANSREHAR